MGVPTDRKEWLYLATGSAEVTVTASCLSFGYTTTSAPKHDHHLRGRLWVRHWGVWSAHREDSEPRRAAKENNRLRYNTCIRVLTPLCQHQREHYPLALPDGLIGGSEIRDQRGGCIRTGPACTSCRRPTPPGSSAPEDVTRPTRSDCEHQSACNKQPVRTGARLYQSSTSHGVPGVGGGAANS